MNPIFEVESLAAETLALQAIVIGVFGRLAQANPDLNHAIGLGFDDAANYVEQITIKLGKQASPAHTSKSLQIVRVYAPQLLAGQAIQNTESSLGER